MIKARIATKPDILALCSFLTKVWKQMGLPYGAAVDTYLALDLTEKPTGNRMAILEDGGKIVAALGSRPAKFDIGLGFIITHLVLDQDRLDREELFERIVLWCGRLAILEGRPIIFTSSKLREHMLGRDLLGMEYTVGGTDPKTKEVKTLDFPAQPIAPILDDILKRHPDW